MPHLLIGGRGFIGRPSDRRCYRRSTTLGCLDEYGSLVAGAGLHVLTPTLPMSMTIRRCGIDVDGEAGIHEFRVGSVKRLAALRVAANFPNELMLFITKRQCKFIGNVFVSPSPVMHVLQYVVCYPKYRQYIHKFMQYCSRSIRHICTKIRSKPRIKYPRGLLKMCITGIFRVSFITPYQNICQTSSLISTDVN